MKLLLANPNTTPAITERMAAAARAVAAPGTEIKPATGRLGASVIASRMEMTIGDYANLELVASEGGDCDAVIVASAIDSGLAAIRQMMDVPVIGITEAALHTACLVGGRFGLVVSSARTGTILREMVAAYGLTSRLAGIRATNIEAQYTLNDPDAVKDAVIRTACALVEEDQTDSVILTSAVMAGMPAQIADRVPVPVMEGVACAVVLAEALVRLGLRKATSGSYARPQGRQVSRLGEALMRRFAE
ncbi:aspartate/glutamate racemase family protein [Humitalea sp. 24SJ18S-53]|uniref:aspartate/glutamate racemase family protein n=1 Tax=Humitalea sp. 24SJ18S-53 TaxID=3422307 RepID=UPI003D6766B4